MTVPGEKIALFIDGANLYATAKSLGFDIDYKRLLREFQSRGYLLRAFYYTAVIEDQEYSSIRPLIDWLDYNGYSVVTKATKEFVDQTGRRKVKGNMDIELAVDAMEIAAHDRPHGAVLRRRRLPLAGRGGAAQGRARDRRSRRSRRSRRWSPTNCAARPTSSLDIVDTASEDRPRSVRARRRANRAVRASDARARPHAAVPAAPADAAARRAGAPADDDDEESFE